MPPPQTTPAPGKGKGLPKWAWAAAVVVGLLVGLLLLRRQPPASADEDDLEEDDLYPDDPRKGGGGAGGARPLLEAFGLVPTDEMPQYSDDGGWDLSYETADTADAGEAPLNADIQPSSPFSTQTLAESRIAQSLPDYGTVSDTSKGGSFGTPPPSAPAPTSTGSAAVKAQ